MATDREAVVWTGMGGRPRKMGRLYLTEGECRFTYDGDYPATGQPGIGVVFPPDIVGRTTIHRTRSEYFDLLPPFQSLVPPRGERNFQRRLLLDYLAKKGVVLPRGFATDWELLMIAGHGGIGHLDVFADDDRAGEWYHNPRPVKLHQVKGEFGSSLKQFLTWFSDDTETLLQLIGPTPSVGGAIPKLLVSIPDSGWDGRIGLPTRSHSAGVTDAILKFEQTVSYPGITELEALALDLHEEAGFAVPRRWRTRINEIPTLVIERFDRNESGVPLFTETLYSVLASGDHRITNHYSTTYDAIGRAIDISPIDLVSDRRQTKEYLLKRLLLALATGNGDLHLENLSLIHREGELSFSPVYDPTPMRAYHIHNLLAVMPFGDYGEVHLQEALVRFARNLGFRKNRLVSLIEEVLSVTADYPRRIRALKQLPDPNRKNLIGIVTSVQGELEKIR